MFCKETITLKNGTSVTNVDSDSGSDSSKHPELSSEQKGPNGESVESSDDMLMMDSQGHGKIISGTNNISIALFKASNYTFYVRG